MRHNPFQQLRGLCEGAEHEFDGIVSTLIRTKYPDARRVRVYRGDGGVDTSYGDWGDQGSLDVFQVKYFPDVFGDAQKAQIRDSYKVANANGNFRMRKWILCLPTILRQEDLTWFDKWKAEQDTHIELWDGDRMEELLGLPGASSARDRLQRLGVVGLPHAQAVLEPILHARPDITSFGTRFSLQLDIINTGDRSAHDVRLIIKHSKTSHPTLEAVSPWQKESPVLNPRSLSSGKSINPGETLLVMAIPFGEVIFPVEITIQVTCRDTPKKEWRAVVDAAAISSSGRIPFQATSLAREELLPRTDGQPEFGPAQEILDRILENPNVGTRGVSVILRDLPGGAPGHVAFYATTEPSSKGLLSMERETLAQALQELKTLGWLKDCGEAGATRVYSLIKAPLVLANAASSP